MSRKPALNVCSSGTPSSPKTVRRCPPATVPPLRTARHAAKEDDAKEAYCDKELDVVGVKKKAHEPAIVDSGKAAEDAERRAAEAEASAAAELDGM